MKRQNLGQFDDETINAAQIPRTPNARKSHAKAKKFHSKPVTKEILTGVIDK